MPLVDTHGISNISNTQTEIHKRGKRFAAGGVTVGTICGVEFTRLEEVREAAKARLDVAEAEKRARWSREIHLTVAELNRLYLEACSAVPNSR